MKWDWSWFRGPNYRHQRSIEQRDYLLHQIVENDQQRRNKIRELEAKAEKLQSQRRKAEEEAAIKSIIEAMQARSKHE